MEPDGELVGVTRGLIYQGYLLAYDPTSNLVGWVPICSTTDDLSLAEDSSAHELSNFTLLEEVLGIPCMEHFADRWAGHTSLAVLIANVPILQVEGSQLGATAEEGASFQAAVPGGEEVMEVMLVSGPETLAAPETEGMEVELLEPVSWESPLAHMELGN